MKSLDNSKRDLPFNLQSWLTLALAVGFIVMAILYLVLAFKQPSDGWLYETRLDGQMIAVGPLLEDPGTLQPDDQVLTIENLPVTIELTHPVKPPPTWQEGGAAQYTILRDGRQLSIQVPLHTRSFSSILRFYALNQSFLLTNLLWYLIGFGVFFLRPRETAAGLLLLITTYWNTIDTFLSVDTNPAPYYYPAGLFWANIILNSLWLFMFAMIIHFVLVFPVRKWPLSRYPRLSLLCLYSLPATSTILAISSNQLNIYNLVLGVMALSTILALILATIDSLRKLHTPVIRAQLGWVALGIGTPVAGALISFTIQSLFPDLKDVYLNGSWSLISITLPLCFGIAITRYRLFDINVIIRRTLVYGMLTASLVLVYFGAVVVLQQIFNRISGSAGNSPLAIVLSTLAIASLFTPLRRRIQTFIDQRYYRRKYDAELTLQTVAALIRDEVELESLTGYLVDVVQETMQPAIVSIWINPHKPS